VAKSGELWLVVSFPEVSGQAQYRQHSL